MAEIEPGILVLANVVCRDDDARYLVVPSPEGATTELELPTGIVRVAEDLTPITGAESTFSLSGCEVELVEGRGPISVEQLDPDTEVHTYLARLAGHEVSRAPIGARWLFPTALDRLNDLGEVDTTTVRGIRSADVRLRW